MRACLVFGFVLTVASLLPRVGWVSGAEESSAFSKHHRTRVSSDVSVTYSPGHGPDPEAVRVKDVTIKQALARAVGIVDQFLDEQVRTKHLDVAEVSMTMKMAEVYLDDAEPFTIKEPTLVHFTRATCAASSAALGHDRFLVDVSIALRSAPPRAELTALLKALCGMLRQRSTMVPATLSFVPELVTKTDAGTFQADAFGAREDLAATFTSERARYAARFAGIVTRVIAGLKPSPKPKSDAPEDFLRISDTEAPLSLDFKRFGKNDWLTDASARAIKDRVWVEMRKPRRD